MNPIANLIETTIAVTLRLLLGVALCGWAAGCGPGPLEPCGSDADCERCQHCIDGNCIPDLECLNQCDPPCDAPPPAECLDGSSLRAYRGQGRCEQGTCAYDFQDFTCAQACQNGACLGEPCAGKFCDQPPGPCFASPGTCRPDSGICDYPLLADGSGCDDGDGCTSGDLCQAGQCRGAPVGCGTPPEPECLDADTMRAYSANGACVAGACSYPSQDIDCASGCADGTCSGNPCAGVVCDSPPGPCFQPTGTCKSGVCSYPLRNGASCNDSDSCTTADRCFNGTCTGDPLVCNQAPNNTCQDADTMRSYSATGVCRTGACDYPYQDVVCSQGCAAGTCIGNPCADLTCDQPPSECYLQAGTCSAGTCFYSLLNGAACDDGDACSQGDVCQNGTCRGQPQICDQPPVNECLNGTTLRAYAGLGACQAGGCVYPQQDVTCAFGCNGGYCVGDPCYGVTCDTPPSPCFARYGLCEQGVCEYATLDGATCNDQNACTQADACSAGVCRGTPLVCDAPPSDTCLDATRLRVYAPVGSCASGTCSYPHQDVTCAEGCAYGRCGSTGCEALSLVASADVTSSYEAGRLVGIAGAGPFALVWEKRDVEGALIQFRSLNADGSFAGQERNLGFADGGPYSIASSGSAFAVAPYKYGQPSELWRFDAAGALLGTTPLGSDSGLYYRPPAVAWGGNQWAVAIDTQLALVNPTGQLTKPGVRQGYDMHASLVWTGTEFGLAWVDYGELGGETSFQRLSAAGSPLGSPLSIGGAICMDGCQSQTALAWNGSQFLLAYAGEDGLHLARLAADGASVLSDRIIDQAATWDAPHSLAYNSARGEVAVIYARPWSSPPYQLVVTRCAQDGTGCATTVLVESQSSNPGSGWIQAVGQEYVLAYTEIASQGQNFKVRFARLGCMLP